MKTLAIAVVMAALSIPAGFAAPMPKSPATDSQSHAKSEQAGNTATEQQQVSIDRYHVKFEEPMSAEGKTIPAGRYTVVVKGNRATLRNHDERILKGIKVETNDAKFELNATRYTESKMANSPRKLTEIDLGGTNKKLVFG